LKQGTIYLGDKTKTKSFIITLKNGERQDNKFIEDVPVAILEITYKNLLIVGLKGGLTRVYNV